MKNHDMSKAVYTSPLTGAQFHQDETVYFRVNDQKSKKEKKGVLMLSGSEWKIVSRQGVFAIASTGWAAAPETIRKALK